MKSILSQLIVGLVLLLVGAFVGIMIENSRSTSEGKLRYFDYRIEKKTKIIVRPRIPGKTLKLRIKDEKKQEEEEIENISSVSILLYNLSDRDFENVPIYINLNMPMAKAGLILSENVVGRNDNADCVSGLLDVKQPSEPNILRYGYKLAVANRSLSSDASLMGGLSPVFTATYLIRGDILPEEVDIAIAKKGLSLREFSWGRVYRTPWYSFLLFPFFMLLFVAIFYLIQYLPPMRKRELRKRKKKYEEFAQRLEDTFSEKKIKTQLGFQNAAHIKRTVQLITKLIQELLFPQMSILERRFLKVPDLSIIETSKRRSNKDVEKDSS